jgi:tetratricopeptide (TPR) repeat protein
LISELRIACQDPAQLYEIDFLAARCAIARIEFDKAHRHLSAVVDAAQDSKPPVSRHLARALWMRGELMFLQQKYDQAIDDYQAAINTGDELWTRRASLQAAKCYELIGDLDLAAATYEQVIQDAHDTAEADFARQRIAYILNSANSPLEESRE